MPVKIKPTSQILIGLGLEKGGKVEKFATETCARYMDDFVPFDNGDLARYNIVGNEIHYDQPYAHYMYEGIVYVDPQTGASAYPIKDKNGNLQGFYSKKGVAKVSSGKSIKYNTSGHTYAGPHWDKRMMEARGSEVIKEIQNYARRH